MFETDRTIFDKVFDSMSDAILKNNESFFDNLMTKITTIPVIKTIEDDGNKTNIVSNIIDKNKHIKITKVNFFANIPIELRIIDCLWAMLFGYITHPLKNNHCYANQFSKDLFGKGNTVLDKINFKSLSLFEPYYNQYIGWKNDTIKRSISEHDSTDLTIFSLDLTRYFYSAHIDFSLIRKIFSEKCANEYNHYSFITAIIEKLYLNYSKELKKYDYSIEKDQVCIPIGIISSYVLANYYLYDFDNDVSNTSGVIYYARYVDDMLIVVNSTDYNSLSDLALQKFNKIMTLSDDVVFINNHYKVSVQSSKTILKKVSKNGSVNILTNLLKEVRPSEPRLFPSYYVEMKDLLRNVSAKNDSIKFRETNEVSLNTSKLISTINGYLFLKRSVLFSSSPRKSKERIKKDDLEEFVSLLNPQTILNIYSRWNKVFVFAALHKNASEIKNKIENNIKIALRNLELDLDANLFNSKSIKRQLKKHLNNLLSIARAQTIAIIGKNKTGKLTEDEALGIAFRQSSLIDFNAICLPLISFVDSLPFSVNLHLMQAEEMINYSKNDFDLFKIKYSPRFIHLGDYMFLKQLSLINKDQPYKVNYSDILKNYYSIFENVFGNIRMPLSINARESSSKTYHSYEYIINDDHSYKTSLHGDLYVGLANIDLDKEPIVGKNDKLIIKNINNPSNKSELTKLLNDCYVKINNYYYYLNIRNKRMRITKKIQQSLKPVSFVVFPETFLPIWWLDIFMRYSKNTGAVIVSGIKYVVYGRRVFNFQVVVIPYRDKYGHKETLVFLREKNHYAPFEKEIITKSGLSFKDHTEPIYYSFKQRDLKFSTFICYEMTDIFARAMMRDSSDIIFASEYNKDIEYFSNIVESASRDLSCFVVQVNSSRYGDTKIIAPYRDKYKNIASINGGEKASIHIGKIDIKGLKAYLNSYYSIDETINNYSTLKDKPEFNKYKKPSARVIKPKI